MLQLGGNDVHKIRSVVKRAVSLYDFRSINLNCGCPSITSGGAATFGASLMKDKELTAELLGAIKEEISAKPVTVSLKCRIGVVDTPTDLEEWYGKGAEWRHQFLYDYIESSVDKGVDEVVLHARPAVLSGLSPVKNRIVPQLDYQAVQRIDQAFEQVDVVLNGGIKSYDDMQAARDGLNGYKFSGYMCGRWPLKRPFDLAVGEDKEERELKAVEDYCAYISHPRIANNYPTNELVAPLYLCGEQLISDLDEVEGRGGREHRLKLMKMIQRGLDGFTHEQPSREQSLSRAFRSSVRATVGKKVYSKWKKNRAELS